jgi:hypothetical protein
VGRKRTAAELAEIGDVRIHIALDACIAEPFRLAAKQDGIPYREALIQAMILWLKHRGKLPP